MKIIKGSDPITVAHPVFALFGQPGICKTSLGYSAPEPLNLDFDKGAHRAVNRRDTLEINDWKDVEELMKDPDALKPYQTVVVDTVGRCLDVMSVAIIDETPKYGNSGGGLSLQGFGVLKSRFQTWMARLRALGKEVVLLSHAREEKDGDTTIWRPDITGGSYGEVMKIADFVGFLYMRGKDRVLDFNPTDRWVGKNPGQWKPYLVPAPEKATTFLAGLLVQGREALGSISEAQAAIVREVEDWRGRIGAMETAEACTKAVGPVLAIKTPIVREQARRILADHTKAKGFTWDAAKKAFAGPTQASTPAALPGTDASDVDRATQEDLDDIGRAFAR